MPNRPVPPIVIRPTTSAGSGRSGDWLTTPPRSAVRLRRRNGSRPRETPAVVGPRLCSAVCGEVAQPRLGADGVGRVDRVFVVHHRDNAVAADPPAIVQGYEKRLGRLDSLHRFIQYVKTAGPSRRPQALI